MKTRKIGRILTVMFLSGGLMTGCQKKQTVVLPEKEQKEEATKTESKNKATQEISFDEELPKDYEGTLTMWGWDTDYYQTVTQAFQKIYPNVRFEYTSVENKDMPKKYETALIVGGELPDIAWSVIDSRGEVFEFDMWEPLEQEPYNFRLSEVYEYLHPHMINSKGVAFTGRAGVSQRSCKKISWNRRSGRVGKDDADLGSLYPERERSLRKKQRRGLYVVFT